MSVNSKLNYCGVDFGTTNSSLAISQDKKASVLPIDPNNSNPFILKSLVYINPKQQSAVSTQAISRYLHDLDTLPSVPLRIEETGRLIKTFGPSTGSGAGPVIWIPETVEVDNSGRGRLLQSLKSVLTNSAFTGTNIFGKFYTLEDLLGLLLNEIKIQAEKNIGHTLDSIVLGRPVRYVGTGQNDIAISRMTSIAHNVGFKNVEFEYEPIGAAINYGINISQPQNILVFDFGGGTLDICIMKLPEQEILAISGRGIGGDLLDSRLVESKIGDHFGINSEIYGKVPFPSNYRLALTSWYRTTLLKTVKDLENIKHLALNSNQKEEIMNFYNLLEHDYAFDFFTAIDKTKIELSSQDFTNFIFNRNYLNIFEPITRTEFESSVRQEIDESKACIYESLNLAKLKPENIDHIILTGGSSQTPIFQKLIYSIFPQEKVIAQDYFTAVALGLGLRSEQIFATS